MNDYHRKMVDHVYPFLAAEWDATGTGLSQYLEFEEIILGFVRDVRSHTSPGTSRFVQMTCLYEYDKSGLAWGIAHFQETPDWPIELQFEKLAEDWTRTMAEEIDGVSL